MLLKKDLEASQKGATVNAEGVCIIHSNIFYMFAVVHIINIL